MVDTNEEILKVLQSVEFPAITVTMYLSNKSNNYLYFNLYCCNHCGLVLTKAFLANRAWTWFIMSPCLVI